MRKFEGESPSNPEREAREVELVLTSDQLDSGLIAVLNEIVNCENEVAIMKRRRLSSLQDTQDYSALLAHLDHLSGLRDRLKLSIEALNRG